MVANQKLVKLLCSPSRVQPAFGGDDRLHFVGSFLRAVLRATMAVGKTRESVMLEAVDPLVHRLPRYAEPQTQLRNCELPGLRKDRKF